MSRSAFSALYRAIVNVRAASTLAEASLCHEAIPTHKAISPKKTYALPMSRKHEKDLSPSLNPECVKESDNHLLHQLKNQQVAKEIKNKADWDWSKNTMLHYALINASIKKEEEVIVAREAAKYSIIPDNLWVKNSSGYTPVEIAVQEHNIDFLKYVAANNLVTAKQPYEGNIVDIMNSISDADSMIGLLQYFYEGLPL